MGTEQKKAFISYSWDSLEHQQWVYDLMQDLRKRGVDASIDITMTQTQTINLNVMMIQNMRDRDFVIFVLTEKYAQKADALAGAVGFETILSFETLKNNPDKFIFIGRGQGDFNKMLPFHLQGYNVIDFSDDQKYTEALEKLIYRIQEVPWLAVEPLGEILVLKSRTSIAKKFEKEIGFDDFKIPNLPKNVNLDRNQLMKADPPEQSNSIAPKQNINIRGGYMKSEISIPLTAKINSTNLMFLVQLYKEVERNGSIISINHIAKKTA